MKKFVPIITAFAILIHQSPAFASSRLDQPDVHGPDLCQGWFGGSLHPLPCFIAPRFGSNFWTMGW
jgi:hypothetical protein